MTGNDLFVNWTLIVPVIFEPPCILNNGNLYRNRIKMHESSNHISNLEFKSTPK
jgi:hypothetical protein